MSPSSCIASQLDTTGRTETAIFVRDIKEKASAAVDAIVVTLG